MYHHVSPNLSSPVSEEDVLALLSLWWGRFDLELWLSPGCLARILHHSSLRTSANGAGFSGTPLKPAY
jgi:hypothetical protein